MNLTDKVAVVTGASSGLGRAAMDSLIGKGAKVAIFDLNNDSFENIKAQHGDNVRFYHTDVTNEEEVQENLERVVANFGAINICVNCAGFGTSKKTFSTRNGPFPLDLFKKIIDVNLVGTFNVLRLAVEQMAKNELEDGQRGVIVNTSSVAYMDGQAGQVAYSASKAGIVGMTLPIARDLRSLGVRVNTIAPGIMGTEIVKSAPKELIEGLVAQVQCPSRLGLPSEFGLLVSQIIENNYLNGEVIRLDGAIRMQRRRFIINFQSNVIAVTGGSQGLGKAIAKKLSDGGATVIIIGRNIEKLELAEKEIGGNVTSIVGDVADPESVRLVFGEISKKFGKLSAIEESSMPSPT